MRQTPENLVKQEVKKYLYYNGWYSFPILQGLGAHKGICDRIAIKNGIVLFIEIKSSKGSLSRDQVHFKRMIEIHGCHHIVARGYEDIEKYIKENI